MKSSVLCPPSSCWRLAPALRSAQAKEGLSSGFTLVELMVVVAIISILLMLLIPNIRTVREKAWSSHCQNNLRQYGIAMNHYMADYNGYFIHPGAGGVGAGAGYDESTKAYLGTYATVAPGAGGQAGSIIDYWEYMIPAYLPTDVTIQSLSAGNPSIRVCPAVMQQIKKDGNFFDPDSPNFKGFQEINDPYAGPVEYADFEQVPWRGEGYDPISGKLILDPAFTTYAINITPEVYRKNKKDIPENVVAFIDWNAKEGWWARLNYTTWQFSDTNNPHIILQDKPGDSHPKWTNAWWLTEVGFHHLGNGKVYGANYVAMDGHVGWIGSNTISSTNFTGQ